MSDGAVLNINQKFEVIYCYKCNIGFAVSASIRRRWSDAGDNFYCPNGHIQHYTESDVQKLEKQLAQETKRKEWAEQDAIRQRERADTNEKRRISQKAATTRLRNRAKAGVCPCCTRSFKQLAAHMSNKHPDFKPEEGEA